MRILITILILTVFSCKKNKEFKTEVLDGTEKILSTPEENETQTDAAKVLEDVFSDKIEMEVDETVFVIDNGTNRANEDMSAGIMKMLAPQSYPVFKERMMQQPENSNGVKSLSIEEVNLEGKKVLYQRSMTVDDAGDEMMMVMHAFSAGEQNTIMISSYYPKAEENKYLPLIEKSVLSARLRE